MGSCLLLALCIFAISHMALACRPGEFECGTGDRGRVECHPPSVVCDHTKDCYYNDDEANCDAFPDVQMNCGSDPVDGYYMGRQIDCSCSVKYRSRDHRGEAKFFHAGQPHEGSLSLKADDVAPNTTYECIGISGYKKKGPPLTLTPKFAYLDGDITVSPTTIDVCGDEDVSSPVTCQVPKSGVNPAVLFRFTSMEKELKESTLGVATDTHFQQELKEMGPPGGGRMQVTCQATNDKFASMEKKITEFISFRRPPTQPPTVTVLDQTFQGESELNMAVLPHNWTGELTCNVTGGYPLASIVSLRCGKNSGVTEANNGVVRFQNVAVTQKMHGVVCRCEAEHDSSCYKDPVTEVELRIQYPGRPLDEGLEGEDGSDGDMEVSYIIPIVLACIILLLLVVIIALAVKLRKASQGGQFERVQLQDPKA